MSQIFMRFPSLVQAPLVTNNQVADEARRLDQIEQQLEALVTTLAGLTSKIPGLTALAANTAADEGKEISWEDFQKRADAGLMPDWDGLGERWTVVNGLAEIVCNDDEGAEISWEDFLAKAA